jgi:hypothetical protein
MSNRKLFHKAHYNILAKQIRERLTVAVDFYSRGYERYKDSDRRGDYYAVEALVTLALDLAKRFKEDNENFDPLKWLDQCSPDEDKYPLSELWEEVDHGK